MAILFSMALSLGFGSWGVGNLEVNWDWLSVDDQGVSELNIILNV